MDGKEQRRHSQHNERHRPIACIIVSRDFVDCCMQSFPGNASLVRRKIRTYQGRNTSDRVEMEIFSSRVVRLRIQLIDRCFHIFQIVRHETMSDASVECMVSEPSPCFSFVSLDTSGMFEFRVPHPCRCQRRSRESDSTLYEEIPCPKWNARSFQ